MLNRLALGLSPVPPICSHPAHLPAAGRPELLGKAASGGDVVRLS
jgi:hypothetical protein